MDKAQILKLLPHRDPFVFLDRILFFEEGKKAVAELDISGEEFYFQGHFPGRPVMPGVLILESMAQCMAIASGLSHEKGNFGVLVQINHAKFRKAVRPRQTLRVETVIILNRRGMIKGDCQAFLGEELAASAQVTILYVNEVETGKNLL